MKTFIRLTRTHLGLLYCLFVAVGLGISGVSHAAAQDLPQPDGRINQVAHFGGDALYCVDQNFIATNQYDELGGFRLLDSAGQVLWFVPAADITAAIAQAQTTGETVLIAEGYGTYGPVAIYTYASGDGNTNFSFSGYDEFGKPNWLMFKFCDPVRPGASAGEENNSSNSPSEPCIPTASTKRLTSVFGGELPPCEEDCIVTGAKPFVSAARLLMPVSDELPPCELPCTAPLKRFADKDIAAVSGVQPRQSLPCCLNDSAKPFAGLDKNPTQPQAPCEQNTGCKPLALDLDLSKRSQPFAC